MPANFRISFKQTGVKDPVLVNNGKTKTITWTLKGHKGLKRERYMPPFKTLLPTVAFAIPNTWNGIALTLKQRIKRIHIPTELKNIHDPVSLYLYLQHNLENVETSFLSQYYTFTDGNKILENGYASIFDKAALLYKILKDQGNNVKLGIVISKSNPTYPKIPGIGGSFDGFFLSARKPGNGMFNGAFVLVGDSLFLFPGNRYTPLGYIPPEFQEAFYLNITDGSVDIIPALPAEDESFIVERKCKIDGNDLLVTETRLLKGYAEMEERKLAELKEKELKERKEMELASIWKNAELLEFTHTDFDSINLPLKETLSYRVKDFLLNEGELILFQIPSFYTEDSMFSPVRHYNIYLWKPAYYKLTTYLTATKPLIARYIPKGTMVQDSGYYYTYSIYKKRKGYKIEESFRRAISEIPKKDATSYLKCIATPVEYSRKWFIFKSKSKK